MSEVENILISVVAGIITASILLVIKSLFINSFIPWYRHIMFQGTKINGSWYQYANGQKTLMELDQKCDILSGKATIQLVSDTDGYQLEHLDTLKTYDVKGYISERFIILNLKHTDPQRIGVITQLLQIDGDGTLIKGQASWYTPNHSVIVSGDARFYRDEVAAKNHYDKITERSRVINSIPMSAPQG
jgi:hypothetical protein